MFGSPLAIGARTASLIVGGRGIEDFAASSGVTLTGFSVFDGSGQLVANAQVTPQLVAGLDLFLPESATITLFGAGFLAIVTATKIRRRS